MDIWERDYNVARIISGTTKCKVAGREYVVGQPSRENRYLACEVYKDTWQDAHLQGVLTHAEVLVCLANRGVWTDHDEEQYQLLGQKIEEMKVGLYENWSQSTARFTIRKALEKGKIEIGRMEHIRHGLDHVTCEGLATAAKIKFGVGTSLLRCDMSAYWDEPLKRWNEPDNILEEIIEQILSARVNETEMRELCRNEPWRSMWGNRNSAGCGVFGVPSVDLTDEQRSLMLWSSIYDSIREHPDCPSDDILDDDDMIDGWLIIQRKRREASQTKKRGDELGSEKIKRADEVYVPSQTIEDARKVDQLNNVNAANTKAERLAFLKQRGTVSEMQMPDTAQRFQMEVNKLEAQSNRRGR